MPQGNNLYPDLLASGDVVDVTSFTASDGQKFVVVAKIQSKVSGTPVPGVAPATTYEFYTTNSSGALTLALTLGADQAATLVGALTLTGGIAQATAPAGFATWTPPTATSGTDTFFASGTLFVASVFIPANKTLTGIGYLLGSVGGTDRIVVQLNSASGALLANSTLASGGTVAGTAANTQEIAFTSTYAAVGPAMYYIGVSGDGGTAKLRTVLAFCNAGMFANSLTQTVSVPAAIVAPTTFTADKGPIAYVY